MQIILVLLIPNFDYYIIKVLRYTKDTEDNRLGTKVPNVVQKL